MEVNFSPFGGPFLKMPARVMHKCGSLDILMVENGPKILAHALNAWADDQGLRVYFIDLGKSKQKASLESVDGGFWDGCLNQLGFNGIARHVKSQRVGSRLKKQRCGSRLKCKTPEVFAAAGSFVYRVET